MRIDIDKPEFTGIRPRHSGADRLVIGTYVVAALLLCLVVAIHDAVTPVSGWWS